VAAASAQRNVDSRNAAILAEARYLQGDGSFGSAYVQDDGVEFKEETAPNGDRKGQYSYIDPNGKKITVQYTAGKNGFQVSGDHLPKAPAPLPVPAQPAPQQAPRQYNNPAPQQYNNNNYQSQQYNNNYQQPRQQFNNYQQPQQQYNNYQQPQQQFNNPPPQNFNNFGPQPQQYNNNNNYQQGPIQNNNINVDDGQYHPEVFEAPYAYRD